MPRGQNRKHFKDDDVPDDSYESERITKCSLTSLCHPEDRDVRPFLSEAMEYCNKARVLISIVAKHHIFATMKEQAENATRQGIPNTLPLSFEPDQNYLSRVRTMVVKGKSARARGYCQATMPRCKSPRTQFCKVSLFQPTMDSFPKRQSLRYGVTYCTDPGHYRRMTNRDVAAARKIGARYLAKKKGLDLGPWSQRVSAEEVKEGTHVSTVLRDVLTSYESGEYFLRRADVL